MTDDFERRLSATTPSHYGTSAERGRPLQCATHRRRNTSSGISGNASAIANVPRATSRSREREPAFRQHQMSKSNSGNVYRSTSSGIIGSGSASAIANVPRATSRSREREPTFRQQQMSKTNSGNVYCSTSTVNLIEAQLVAPALPYLTITNQQRIPLNIGAQSRASNSCSANFAYWYRSTSSGDIQRSSRSSFRESDRENQLKKIRKKLSTFFSPCKTGSRSRNSAKTSDSSEQRKAVISLHDGAEEVGLRRSGARARSSSDCLVENSRYLSTSSGDIPSSRYFRDSTGETKLQHLRNSMSTDAETDSHSVYRSPSIGSLFARRQAVPTSPHARTPGQIRVSFKSDAGSGASSRCSMGSSGYTSTTDLRRHSHSSFSDLSDDEPFIRSTANIRRESSNARRMAANSRLVCKRTSLRQMVSNSAFGTGCFIAVPIWQQWASKG